MRKNIFTFSILLVLLLVFVSACGDEGNSDTNEMVTDEAEKTELAYEPEAIEDTDVCEVCAMAVPNNEHATQIVLTNDRSLKFDDIGCLQEWIDEHGEDEIGTAFVRDFNSEEWFDMTNGTFVYDETIETPMAYGVISFKDESEADDFIEDFGAGEKLTKDDLANHEWEMNMDMMDHDD